MPGQIWEASAGLQVKPYQKQAAQSSAGPDQNWTSLSAQSKNGTVVVTLAIAQLVRRQVSFERREVSLEHNLLSLATNQTGTKHSILHK